jgi:hypothetical protein
VCSDVPAWSVAFGMTFAILSNWKPRSHLFVHERGPVKAPRRCKRNTSTRSSRNSRDVSVYSFRRQTLGDKLQVLAGVAPRYLTVIERFVDLVLRAAENEIV